MIDAAIPLQTAPQPNFLAQLAQLQTLQGGQQKQQIGAQEIQGNQIKLNQEGQAAQDDADGRAATAAATKVDPTTGKYSVDRGTLLSTLAKLNPTRAAQTAAALSAQDSAAQEAQAKLQKSQADAQSAQVQTALAHVNAKDKLLQGVTDQATYTNAINQAVQLGIAKPGELPAQYDPNFVTQAHAQTLSQKDVLEQHLKDRESDRADQTQAETEDNNAAQRDQASAQLAQTGAHQKAELGLEYSKLAVEKQKVAMQKGDPNLAAQLLINGDATLSELKARGSTPEFIAQTLNAAHQMSGGKYNAQTADAQYSVAKSPTNVAFFGSAGSLTDKGGTLDQLAAAAKEIPGGKLPALNSLADWEKAATGSGPIAKYAAIAVGAADDYAKVMGSGTGSDSSRKQALDLFASKDSPDQRAGSIEGVRGAVHSQINSRIGANPILKRMYGVDSAPQAATSNAATPQSHQFSLSAWKQANPKGDVNAAKAAAAAQGFTVVQ